ncbi:DUF6049 family protein [Georgenia sp.]
MRQARAWARPVALVTAAGALALGPAITAGSAAASTAAGVPVATPDPTVTRTADPTPTDSLAVDITDIGPTVLGPDDALVVRATVTNPTDTDVAAPAAVLRIQRSTPISRSNLQRWLEPDSLFSTIELARQELAGPLPAEASATVVFTVAAADLPLSQSAGSWGPRGIEVRVDGGAAAGAPDGADRNFLLWYPDLAVSPTPVSVLAPVTASAGELTAARTNEESVAAAATTRVAPLLEALDHPGVTTLVDPLLLADAAATDLIPLPPADAERPAAGAAVDAAGTDPGAAAAAALRESLTTLTSTAGREILVLPWADADVSALAHAGRTELLTDALDRAAPLATELGVRADVAWPVSADQESVAAATATGAAAVVLPAAALTPTTGLTYTASARATVPLEDGTTQAVLTDEYASASLAGRLLPRVASGSDELVDLDPLTTRQFLLAQTAVIARERPSDPRPLVLALPRDFDGDATDLGEVLAALAAAPWVEPTTLSGVLDLEAPALSRTELPTAADAVGELDGAVLRAAASAQAQARVVASITPDPQGLLDAAETALAPVLSVAWRADPGGRAGLVEHVGAQLAAIGDAVTALPSSTLNLINASAQIPIHVRNDLGVDVVVQVVLEPFDPRLQVPESVTVTVPAGAEATAQVPVRAVGSGDVPVDVLLRTPDGEPLGAVTELHVRARPDWENVGTAVLAGALAVLLVAGIVRTVRRGPRMDPNEPVPVPEDLG